MSEVLLSGCFDGNDPNSASQEGDNNGQQTGQNEPTTDDAAVPWIGWKNTTRTNSSDPIRAAVLVSKTLWMATSDMNRPGGVVLANADDWQTVLVSVDLIHFPNNGPILFVNDDGLPEATRNELERLKPTGVEMNNGVQVITSRGS